AAAVSAGLTFMGYSQASAGLRVEAEAAIAADAQVVTNSLDNWNNTRLGELQVLARMQVVQHVAAGTATAAERDEALAVLSSVGATAKEVDSVAIMTADGTLDMASDAASQGSKSPQ